MLNRVGRRYIVPGDQTKECGGACSRAGRARPEAVVPVERWLASVPAVAAVTRAVGAPIPDGSRPSNGRSFRCPQVRGGSGFAHMFLNGKTSRGQQSIALPSCPGSSRRQEALSGLPKLRRLGRGQAE